MIGAALLLIVLGAASPRSLAALALVAAPGALGWIYRPAGRAQARMPAVFAAAAGLAVAITGGVTGPLAALCAAPLLAAMAYGGLWRAGAALAFTELTALAVVQGAGGLARASAGPEAFALALIGLALTLGGGAAALMLLIAGNGTGLDGSGLAETAAPPPSQAKLEPEPLAESGPEHAPSPHPDQSLLFRAELEARIDTAEAARERAEADARGKMRFLANMSHELRTPLNAIMGFSDVMRTRLFGDLPPRYAEYAELIHESGQHLLDVIGDVLDVSKIDADKYQLARDVFDVREAANAALRILRQQADDAGVSLRGVLPAQELEVDADRRALKQIVLNLVSNALKFTPRGGSVTVGFAAVDQALEITVTDTGVGIDPEDLVRLGRPFEQAGGADDRRRGSGLGLSLVKAFARLHGGAMAIESRLGEGTSVTVRLPVLVVESRATPG